MSRRILLADDSVTIRKVVELTFMEEDYELEATNDGREALSRLEESAPDLVIADIHMPEVGGLDVARESKAKYPDVPVLLLVGTFEPFDPAEVEASGADEFLKKPFDSQDLLRLVGRLLESSAAATSDQEPSETDSDEPGEEIEAAGVEEEGVAETTEFAPEDETADRADEPVPVEAAEADAPALSNEDIDKIARRVAEQMSDGLLRDVAWEVIPDMAEVVIKERLRELEGQVEETSAPSEPE